MPLLNKFSFGVLVICTISTFYSETYVDMTSKGTTCSENFACPVSWNIKDLFVKDPVSKADVVNGNQLSILN